MSATTMPTLPTEILAKIFADPELTIAELEKCEAAAWGSRAFTSIIRTFGRYPLGIDLDKNGVVLIELAPVLRDLSISGGFGRVKQLSWGRASRFSHCGWDGEDHMLRGYPYISTYSTLLPILDAAQSLSTLRLDVDTFRRWDGNAWEVEPRFVESLARSSKNVTSLDFSMSREHTVGELVSFLACFPSLRALVVDFNADLEAWEEELKLCHADLITYSLTSLVLKRPTAGQLGLELITRSSASTLRHLALPVESTTAPFPFTSLSAYPFLATITICLPSFTYYMPSDIPSLLSTLPDSPTGRRFKLVYERDDFADYAIPYWIHQFGRLPATFTTLDMREFRANMPASLVPSLAPSIRRLGLRRDVYQDREQVKMEKVCEARKVELVWDSY
ncbi:hypothetical protein MNV49_001370 [Pseudohyphozyma bogoriensis]|nr:hypothetical protein MNV49_001370 [Pseudohyphozyma bogoriensis]